MFSNIFFQPEKKKEKLIFVAVFFHNQVKRTKKIPNRYYLFSQIKKKLHLTDRHIFSIFSGSAPDDNIHIQGFGNSTLNNY